MLWLGAGRGGEVRGEVVTGSCWLGFRGGKMESGTLSETRDWDLMKLKQDSAYRTLPFSNQR